MAESLVRVVREGGVAILRLDDPSRHNAMTRAMGEAFSARVAELARDPALRALVVTGSGPSFSAGGDLGMLEEWSREAAAAPGSERIRSAVRSFYELFLCVRDLACPSVAAIHGAAVGAGLCVALACDLRVAARGARLSLNFARLGLHPGMGATWILPRLVGPARAAELLLPGRTLEADEAAAIGLVNRCVAPDELLPAARALAEEIAGCGPLAVRGLKRALARSADCSLEDQLDFEAEEQARCLETRDVREGLAAARERRTPRFADPV